MKIKDFKKECEIQLSINGKICSSIITNLLLVKNLKNHYHIVKSQGESKLLNGFTNAYQYLEALMREHPEISNKIAIIQDREITYAQMKEEYDSLARFLHTECGINPGEKISVCTSPSIEGIISFFAMNKIGAVNARIFNGSKEEKMQKNLIDFDSKVIIADMENLEVILNVYKNTSLKKIILTGNIDLEKIKIYQEKYCDLEIVTYSEAISIGKKIEDNYIAFSTGDELASILYTSGSSGEPKGISISNKVYTNMVDIVCKTTGIKKCDDEKAISVVSHEYPYAAINCTIMVLLMGKTLIMPRKKDDNKIDFNELLSYDPNKAQAIPNFYELLMEDQQSGKIGIKRLSSFNTLVSGGERYLENSKKKLLTFLEKMESHPLLIDGFGFGELGSATALKFGLDEYFLLMNGIEAKTVNPDTLEDLESGKEGLLCLTGPTISDGYYNNEEKTKESFITDKNGKRWFVSDTYGSVHGIGRRLVKLGGRVREYFITADGHGAFVKVYAGSVEDVIASCEVVKDCIVVPSDAGAAPSPVAYISLRTDCDLSQEEVRKLIIEKCKTLELFARPTSLHFENDIERTQAGKKDYTEYKRKALNR